MNWFRLKACAKCKGDLVLDDDDWLCLQCGSYCYTGLYRSDKSRIFDNQEISRWPPETRPATRTEKTQVLAQSFPRRTPHLQRAAYASLVARFSAAAATR